MFLTLFFELQMAGNLEPSKVHHTSGLNELNYGMMPTLLWEVLLNNGHEKAPLYVGHKYVLPNNREEWHVEVNIYKARPVKDEYQVIRVYDAHGRRSTFEAGVHDAARQAFVDGQIWHLLRSTGLTDRADRSDRSGLYSPSRIRVFVKSPHVILLVKGYVFPGL